MMNYDDAKRLTAERMDDPRPGDRFHEMYSYWVVVLGRRDGWVVSYEPNRDGTHRLDTPEEFRARFAYGTIPGYWVLYRDNMPVGRGPIDFDRLIAKRAKQAAAESMASAML